MSPVAQFITTVVICQIIITVIILLLYPTIVAYFNPKKRTSKIDKAAQVNEERDLGDDGFPYHLFKNRCERKIQINILNFKDMRQAKQLVDLTKSVIDNSTIDANKN